MNTVTLTGSSGTQLLAADNTQKRGRYLAVGISATAAGSTLGGGTLVLEYSPNNVRWDGVTGRSGASPIALGDNFTTDFPAPYFRLRLSGATAANITIDYATGG